MTINDATQQENALMSRFDSYLKNAGLEKKQYQYDAVKWCLNNEIRSDAHRNSRGENIYGGFLADEMGLGKTITMIGLCVTHFVRRTLVVVPVALINQWAEQIKKTTGHNPLVYYGKNVKKITLVDVLKAPIVVTSYSHIQVFLKEIEKKMELDGVPNRGFIPVKYIGLLHRIKWNRIIFDEAHHLRNIKTCLWNGAKMLMAQSRWFVSGTPIQNNIKDICNLLKIMGFPCSSYIGGSNQIKEIFDKYLLKRTKKEVGIDIPPINIIEKQIDWKNEDELRLCEEIHSCFRLTNVSSKKGGLYSNSVQYAIAVLSKAKQSCIFPKMLEKDVKPFIAADGYYKNAVKHSSKLDGIVDFIISRKDNGNGKIVFCHYKKEIDEIKQRLVDQAALNVVVFDGRTSFDKRMESLNSKCDVLIMQIQTGCEGLNLQENFSEIYFTTAHWNPFVEEQAIARCHRIGQKKEVYVFKFAMSGFVVDDNDDDNDNDNDNDKRGPPITIENYVNSVQGFKKCLAKDLLSSEYEVQEVPEAIISN